MKPIKTALCGAVLAAAGLAGGAWAGDTVRVALPDVAAVPEAEAKALLSEIAQVNVITANCPGQEISNGEWTLLTGTGDRLASRLGLGAAEYDRLYYAPAFKLLDDPEACGRIGPTAQPLIDKLVGMGGGTTPVK